MDHPQKPVLPRRPKRTRTAHAQRDEATKLLMMSQRASLQSDWSSAPQLGTGGSAPVVAKAAPTTVMGKKLRGAILHVRGEKAAKDQDLAKALGLMTEFSATGMKVHSRKTLCRANGTASPSGPGSPGPLTPARMKAKVIFKDPDRESAKEFQDRLKSKPELLARMRRVGKLVLQAAEIRQVPIPSSSFAAGAAKSAQSSCLYVATVPSIHLNSERLLESKRHLRSTRALTIFVVTGFQRSKQNFY